MSSILLRTRCPSCRRTFTRGSGLTQHINSIHGGHRTVLPRPAPSQPAGIGHETGHSPPPQPMDTMDVDNDTGRVSPPPPMYSRFTFHKDLNGRICDSEGRFLPEGTPPPPQVFDPKDYSPFEERADFHLADFLYRDVAMGKRRINTLMQIWAVKNARRGEDSPFEGYRDLDDTIDAIPYGDLPWKSFAAKYDGPLPAGDDSPSWMTAEYDVWYRDPKVVIESMLSNPDFKNEFDYTPYRDYTSENVRRWKEMMSGDWAWLEADTIMREEGDAARGALMVSVILGSDKTTVSVATGNNEYYPLYMSIGNLHNNVRRAHRESLILLGFLSIPKAERASDNDQRFRQFRRQLYHSSIAAILQTLRPGMTQPQVMRCPDGHYRRVLFSLASYIADYPEQALLACIVQGWCPKCTNRPSDLDSDWRDALPRTRQWSDTVRRLYGPDTLWDAFGILDNVEPFTQHFPRADIHRMITMDLLHQVIKGSFKDHLVTWVGELLEKLYGKAEAARLMDEIDRRIAATPSFPGLRRFPQGRRFKQWTGDDSKALMKVYLPAIDGLLPSAVVRCISAFMDFCYLVRRSVINEDDIRAIENALDRFHRLRDIFKDNGACDSLSLPRQHALTHYPRLIRDFGAPNGLCTSITESKHIVAVKKPWRQSNKNQPLGQMLLTNQRLSKLAAATAVFKERGMLEGSLIDAAFEELRNAGDENDHAQSASSSHSDSESDNGEEDIDDEEDPDPLEDVAHEYDEVPAVLGEVVLARTPARGYPSSIMQLALYTELPDLPELVRRFLYDQLNRETSLDDNVPIEACPTLSERIRFRVFHSARATFHAPSDISGVDGARHEYIRSTPMWRRQGARRDCVFVETDAEEPGMRGLDVLRVKLLFDFDYGCVRYPCALVEWFTRTDDEPDPDTGMWTVAADVSDDGERDMSVVHIDTIFRLAHLIPVYGNSLLPPKGLHFSLSLDAFDVFFVNKYADHHTNEIAF